MNTFGRRLRVGLFGESHGAGVGIVMDGVPAGLPVDPQSIQRDLDERRPGGPLASGRQEPDRLQVQSGTLAGRATGAPLALWIENEDARPQDYPDLARRPRPGHADYPARVATHGFADLRGGGHASGRLTAPLVAAGSVAAPLLARHGIACAAHLHQVGPLAGPPHAHDARTMAERAARSDLRTAHTADEAAFRAAIEEARRDRDSVGGVVEFVAEGLPVGLGDPFFDAAESLLAHLLFAIPAVKGVDFGAGFGAAAMRGSIHNDPFAVQDGHVAPATNHAGGILGGRTTGAPIRGRVAVKPASTLPGRPQSTVDVETLAPAQVTLKGRHDPCIAIRAVPVVQACLRLVLADLVLQATQDGLLQAPDWRQP